jgi:hypothetical protein
MAAGGGRALEADLLADRNIAGDRMETLGGSADRHLEQALRAVEARERQERSEEHCRNEPQTTSRRRCLNVFDTAQDVELWARHLKPNSASLLA